MAELNTYNVGWAFEITIPAIPSTVVSPARYTSIVVDRSKGRLAFLRRTKLEQDRKNQ